MQKIDIKIAAKIDEIANRLLRINPESRPFVCDGIPKAKSIFIVGYNPATLISKKWSEYWSCAKGYDINEWTKDYERQRKESGKSSVSRTRRRINEIKNSSSEDFFETNIYSIPSKDVKSLSSKNRSSLPQFIELIKPRALIIHGKDAEKNFKRMYHFEKDKIPEIGRDIIFCTHLSRISNAEFLEVKNKLRIALMKSKEINEFVVREMIYGFFLNADNISERKFKFKKEHSSWYIETETTYEQERTIIARAKINSKIPEIFLSKMREIKIPMNVDHGFGCDGSSIELLIGNLQECSMLRWWENGPKEWHDVSRLTGELINNVLALEKHKFKA